MGRHRIRIGETIATVISEPEFLQVAEKEVLRQRSLLKDYINSDPLFSTTLKPYKVSGNAPEIVRRMAEASCKAGVGPMAAVAGAIAEFSVKAMLEAGAEHVIFDNGGDVTMHLSKPVIMGIYAGEKGMDNLGIRMHPQEGIFGVCTSSGTVGHSLSFGKADAATVIAKDVILADATATALGNYIQCKDKKLIQKSMNSFLSEDIQGMIVIKEDFLGLCGEIPEMVKVSLDFGLITKG